MVTNLNKQIILALLALAPLLAVAQTSITSDSTDIATAEHHESEQYWRRTRFILSGAIAMPSGAIESTVEAPVFGGAVEVEFASRSSVRPLLDFSGLYIPGARNLSDIQQFSSHAGLRWFPAKKMAGIHFDMLWGVNLNTSEYQATCFGLNEKRMGTRAAPSLGAGLGVVQGPVALSLRYQIAPIYDPLYDRLQWDGWSGYAVFRLGFVLGGGLRPFANNAEKMLAPTGASMTGSAKNRLAWQTARADSLDRVVMTRDTTVWQLMEQQEGLEAEIALQKVLAAQTIAEAEAVTDSIRSQPSTPLSPIYKILHESPHRFGAVGVYTVLRSFSSTLRPDTFRVVTTVPPNGGFKHELQISTVKGNLYKEEFYAQPLPGVTPNSAPDEERELLRVRMALAPDVFLPDPVTDASRNLSEARETEDLVFQLSKEQFNTVFNDQPQLGFRFQSEERTTKVLVYSPTLDRIVNIQPE